VRLNCDLALQRLTDARVRTRGVVSQLDAENEREREFIRHINENNA